MTDIIHIKNNGQEIVETNYYDTPNARAGYFYLSTNAGCFRLLVPDSQLSVLSELSTGREIIISRGPWPEQRKKDALELLFEDDSDNPFSLHILPEQCDRLPEKKDAGKRWLFSVWSRTGKHFEAPCYYRQVKKLPWLKPYTGQR